MVGTKAEQQGIVHYDWGQQCGLLRAQCPSAEFERQIGTPWRPGSGASEAVGPSECPIERNNMIGSGNQDKDWLQYREKTAQCRYGG